MPALQLFTNNATGRLAAELDTLSTTLVLQPGQGMYFPSPLANQFFYLTLVDASNYIEIVKCTARTSDTLTIERAQEGTGPRSFAVDDICELRVTAGSLGRFAQLDSNAIVTGNWTFNNNILVPVMPVAPGHGASKQYVDALIDAHDHAGDTIGPVVLVDGSTATTQVEGDNSTKVATTEYIDRALANLGGTIEMLATPLTFEVRGSNVDWTTVTLAALPDGVQAAFISGAVPLAANFSGTPQQSYLQFRTMDQNWTLKMTSSEDSAYQGWNQRGPFPIRLVNKQLQWATSYVGDNGGAQPIETWSVVAYVK